MRCKFVHETFENPNEQNPPTPPCGLLMLLRGSGFGFGCRVWSVGYASCCPAPSRCWCCGGHGFGFSVSDSRFRVQSFGFQVVGPSFRVSGFGFRVSGCGIRVSGFGFRDRVWCRQHLLLLLPPGISLLVLLMLLLPSGSLLLPLLQGVGFRV